MGPTGEEPVVRHDERGNRFVVVVDDEVAGVADYVDEDGVRLLLETEVRPEHEGHGLGGRLARAELDDARARGLKVVPRCEFMARYLERHHEYGDLLAPQGGEAPADET